MQEEKQVPETPEAETKKAPKVAKRVRRVFQCGDPKTAPVQIVTYTSPPRTDANGFRFGPVCIVRERNECFQFAVPADSKYYDEEVAAMRQMVERTAGAIQEIGANAENKLPDSMQPKTADELNREIQELRAVKSTLDLRLGKLLDDKSEEEDRLKDLERENARLKELLKKHAG